VGELRGDDGEAVQGTGPRVGDLERAGVQDDGAGVCGASEEELRPDQEGGPDDGGGGERRWRGREGRVRGGSVPGGDGEGNGRGDVSQLQRAGTSVRADGGDGGAPEIPGGQVWLHAADVAHGTGDEGGR